MLKTYFVALFNSKDKIMRKSTNNQLLSRYEESFNLVTNNFEQIKYFLVNANSRLDAINAITNNSHAIAADAVTAMICENQDSLNSQNTINTTNKMSVCLRDGEIILRYITYLLITNDKSIIENSCLKDLKNTYLALGVPLSNAIRIVELIRDATIIDIDATANLSKNDKDFAVTLIQETKAYFDLILDLLK